MMFQDQTLHPPRPTTVSSSLTRQTRLKSMVSAAMIVSKFEDAVNVTSPLDKL